MRPSTCTGDHPQPDPRLSRVEAQALLSGVCEDVLEGSFASAKAVVVIRMAHNEHVVLVGAAGAHDVTQRQVARAGSG